MTWAPRWKIEERMAGTRQLQRASIPKSFTSRATAPRPRSAVALLVVSALTAVWAAAMLSPFGNIIDAYMFVFVVFFAGPVTLVSLSLTVMVGLVATDRIVLLIRHRVLLQSAHRALGIIAVIGLVLHVLTKISAGHVSASNAFLPFVGGANVYVGLGTVAGLMMVGVLWTGLIRARFAGIGKPWMWRALHSVAYAAWPIALVHGLEAGRTAATWVTASYLLCVAMVVVLLLLRLSVSLGRKREASQTTGSMAPVGRPAKPAAGGRAGTAAPARRRTADEIRASRQNAADRDGRRGGSADRGNRRSGTADRDDLRDTGAGRWSERTASAERDDRRGGAADREPQADREPSAGRRRRSLDDLRGDGTEPGINSWARAGEFDTTDSSRRGADRFTVPEVPLDREALAGPGRRDTAAEPELPWDSPRRWTGDDADEPWDRPGRGSDNAADRPARGIGDSRYRRLSSDDEPPRSSRHDTGSMAAVDLTGTDPGGTGRRPWRDPDDEAPTSGAPRAGRRRRDPDDEPGEERGGRHSRGRDETDAEESTLGWGRAARYEPNLVARRDEDDEELDTPTLVNLAARRARRGSAATSRSSRRRKSDEAAEEGAYWTSLKGDAR
ncbi:hypothetical protein [Plantactinospora sp. B5E13]|uniref:hypothetical protein n=1 Tax=Plantactinospora sp. B5E13 TaxID=3153758 RepID=UPI00325E1E46